ncbi:hypothetical protein AVL50_09440 [Flammeovirga sp. SJP92]|nr:hypothetical protein AVL50_09440 [Flammeovirga sp. SJP92]
MNSNAQGLNIQQTLAEKEGKSTVELFKERKEERKTKKKEEQEVKENATSSVVKIRKEDLA